MTSWFALRVRPKHERSCALHLTSRGLEPFTPEYSVRRQWSDRMKVVSLPLFPGYVFCRFKGEQRRDVLTAPGVASIVSFGDVPAEVTEQEIANVRTIVKSGAPYGPWPYLRAGERVRIEEGCMKGLCGTLLRDQDRFRVVVNVELLQRSVAVEIDRESVQRPD